MAERENTVHWIEVKLQCDGELAEALAEVLGRFVSYGVVMENVTRFNPQTQENEPTGVLNVFGYLPFDENLEDKRDNLDAALGHLGLITPVPKPHYKPIQDQNWMKAWKQHYLPIPVGQKILILPAWNTPDEGEKRIVIHINPAMAFGTGTHPSTQLCLRLLERHIKKGEKIIDVGCGSGILSIAALKLGAAHAVAVDTNSRAVRATLENAAINHLTTGALETGIGSVKEILSGQFAVTDAPLVMVNILAKVIIHLFDHGLVNLVREGGMLLLSGILKDQLDEVLHSARVSGFSLVEQLSDGDWVSLAMQKSNRRQ
ncbi:MAG: 50S ribosomal protein L11 methyltransferase [Chloroflexota bacterium]|nr:50S ribosomal protein L11 methyltransferase [Chloroflexota bacterium]